MHEQQHPQRVLTYIGSVPLMELVYEIQYLMSHYFVELTLGTELNVNSVWHCQLSKKTTFLSVILIAWLITYTRCSRETQFVRWWVTERSDLAPKCKLALNHWTDFIENKHVQVLGLFHLGWNKRDVASQILILMTALQNWFLENLSAIMLNEVGWWNHKSWREPAAKCVRVKCPTKRLSAFNPESLLTHVSPWPSAVKGARNCPGSKGQA